MADSKIEEVIVTKYTYGKGTEKDPVRLCVDIHTKDGKLLAHFDPEFNSNHWCQGMRIL